MDSFNRVISFVLGLVVVLVFFAVITGRLRLPGKISTPFSKSPTPTVVPTKTVVNPTPISTVKINDKTSGNVLGNSYKTVEKPGAIPATGLPTLFIPTLLAGAAGGAFLRKAGKNN